jgi:hypothetical protein
MAQRMNDAKSVPFFFLPFQLESFSATAPKVTQEANNSEIQYHLD